MKLKNLLIGAQALCWLFLFSLPVRAQIFQHPGLLHKQSDFDRVKAKVNAGAQPWLSGWNRLTGNSHASLNWTARPADTIYRGSDGVHAQNYPQLYGDIAAAYATAVRWKISGDTAYANKSIQIMNAWSPVLKALGGNTDVDLAAGIYGYEFANAAEIMRTYTGWSATDFARFQTMMLTVFYPINHDFLIRHNNTCTTHYWANWDQCNMMSVLAIGVLCDNRVLYNEGVNYFKSGIGNGCIERAVYYVHPDSLGQWQESGRDQGHAMLGIGLMSIFCQMAWNQGDDLFGYDNSRFLKGAEYVAKYNLGDSVLYQAYNNCENANQTVIGSGGRGDVRPIWELIYNHYVKGKGIAAPYSTQYADSVRPEGGGGDYGSNSGGYDQLGYGTLLYTLDTLNGPALYQGTDFSGVAAGIKAGAYNLSALQTAGIVNNTASSLRMPEGYTVTLYDGENFDGTAVILKGNNSNLATAGFNDKISSIQVQAPYGNTIRSIPGTIEAEDFDQGGEGIAYHDADAVNSGGKYRTGEHVDIEACSEGGYDVGWLKTGEWLEYTVNVATTASYKISMRVGTPNATGMYHIELDSSNITGTVSVPNTGGWQKWVNVDTILTLPAGLHLLRIYMDGSDFNINKISFTANSGNILTNGTYTITARHSNKHLQATGIKGALVLQQTASGNNNQIWTATSLGNGYYKIINAATGLAMDVSGVSLVDGGLIIQWTYSGANNQQWQITDVGDGAFRITSRNSGKSLQVADSATIDGTNLVQWTYSGGYNEQFLFAPATVSSSSAARTGVAPAPAIDTSVTASTEVMVYPNPVTDRLIIKLKSHFANGTTMRLFDSNGRLLFTVEVKGADYELGLGNVPPGIYFLQISDETKSITKKILKL